MHRLRGLTLEHVKDYVAIGSGVAVILGGLITGAAVFLGGGDGSDVTAVVPTATVADATPSKAPTDASPTPAPTDTPAPAGEFLRVQFGTQQDPVTFLPAGDTYSPGDEVTVCPGNYLYAWVYHSFEPGTVIDTRFSDRAGVLFSPSIPVEQGQLYVWVSVRVATEGEHTLAVSVAGSEARASWSVEVGC